MRPPPPGLTTLLHAGTLAVGVQIRGFELEVIDGPDVGRAVRATRRSFVVGTDPSADLPLSDPYVSRLHARIEVEARGYVLHDLGSRNGTRVALTSVHAATLDDQATFTIGATTIRFRVLDEPFEISFPREERFESLVGRSPAMREMFAICERVAPSDVPVLLVGETGTGKELIARALHARSPRRERPFVVLDCAALSPTLVESELFGHERGAFTSAVAAHAGVFERADGGTVFLDELGELPTALQPKLLRCLETGEVRRVGGTKTMKVDVRVVAATNRDLVAMVRENTFRADLYYRLAVVQITVPALRDRREDIGPLARHFVERARERVRGSHVDDIDLERVLGRLADHRWPGNVRELRNLVERALVLADDHLIRSGTPQGLGEAVAEVVSRPPSLREARASADRAYLDDLLRSCGGDLDEAARVAQIHRKSLERLLRGQRREHDIDEDD